MMLVMISGSGEVDYGFLREGNLVVNGRSAGHGNLSLAKIYPLLRWEDSLPTYPFSFSQSIPFLTIPFHSIF